MLARAKLAIQEWRLTIQVARLAGYARRQASSAANASKNQLVFTGMYAGLLDAGESLQLGSWDLARRLFPVPASAPTEAADIHAYVAGYLEGHALLTVAHAAWRRGDNPWGMDGRARAIATYATVIASPEAQETLMLPGETNALKAHHIACLIATKERAPIDWQTELDLFRWLMARSGLKISPTLEERLRRQRRRRQERLEPPAA